MAHLRRILTLSNRSGVAEPLRPPIVPLMVAVSVFFLAAVIGPPTHAGGAEYELLARFDSAPPLLDRVPEQPDEGPEQRSAEVSVDGSAVTTAVEIRSLTPGRAVALAVWNVGFEIQGGQIACWVFAFAPPAEEIASISGSAGSWPFSIVARAPLERADAIPSVPDGVVGLSYPVDLGQRGHVHRSCFALEESGEYWLRTGVGAIASVRGDYIAAGWARARSQNEIWRSEVWLCPFNDVDACARGFLA